MSTPIPDNLQQLIADIEDDQLFRDDSFKQQIIDFVRSLSRFDQEYYDQLNNLVGQKAFLNDEQIKFLTSFVLVKALKIENSRIRVNSIRLLEGLGELAHDAVPTLVELMIDEKEHQLLQVAIAQALAQVGLTDFTQANNLTPFISATNAEVQRNVISAISTLGEAAAPVIPMLKAVLLSSEPPPDKSVIIAILSCFGEMHSKAASVALLSGSYLKPDHDEDIRYAAAQSLFQIGVIPGVAISQLIAGLSPTEKINLRIAFINALAYATTEKDKIAAELSNYIDDDDINLNIVEALSKINTRQSTQILAAALVTNPDLVSIHLHRMAPDSDWKIKTGIILANLSKDNRPVQAYSNLEFPHIFYAMLPPSEKSISNPQDVANVEELCQVLIDSAFKNRKNDNFFTVVTKIITIGSRLDSDSLKAQVDRYQNSNQIESDLLLDLRTALGDTSALETEISQLNAQLNNTLRNYLDALNKQGDLTLAHTKTQFTEVLWMNRCIFGFGFVVGTVSVGYFFYYLLVDPDVAKTLVSLLGSAAGIASTFLVLFYKPQKQGQEAINNLSKSNVILGGFVFEMAHIAESLARLQASESLTIDEMEAGSKVIQAAYGKAIRELQNINKDLIDS